MTSKAEVELLKAWFKDFKNELKFSNVDVESIIEEANDNEAYCFKNHMEATYEVFLKRALSKYLMDWAEDWGWK